MTPDELAKSGTEHGTQRALFAWVRWAEIYGFEAAFDCDKNAFIGETYAVPELRWCHSIPNGGLRDKITAGKLKQEGALSGILDIHLPLPIAGHYAGLYIEMKRSASEGRRKGNTSNAQDDFIAYARRVGYAVSVCFDWRSAANDIEKYVRLYRETVDALR